MGNRLISTPISAMITSAVRDERDYEDLGADYLDSRNDTQARIRYLVRPIEHLGHTVTTAPAA